MTLSCLLAFFRLLVRVFYIQTLGSACGCGCGCACNASTSTSPCEMDAFTRRQKKNHDTEWMVGEEKRRRRIATRVKDSQKCIY